MDIKETMQKLNLDGKQTKVYLAALELGLATAKDIAQKAGLQRTYFYDIAEDLIKLDLLKQVKQGKKRMFLAAEPEKLLALEKEKIQQLTKIMPRLKAIYNSKGQKPKIFYYEGRAGIDKINDDTLRYQGEIAAFTTPRFVSADEQKLSQDYIKRRIEANNKIRIIGELSPEIMELKKKDKEELRETRILPKNIFSSEVEIGIYGNKVYIIDYKEEFGFIIEGSEIAKTMKNIFEIIWQSGKILEVKE